MDDARTLIMRATGLDASELPYVAELMDVNEQDEQWRLAMNVTYAPIARPSSSTNATSKDSRRKSAPSTRNS